ncbi:MAG: DUF268 domain-containing protein [Acidimicrobiales bacterium]|nr:DUF268 domain-containing protein [Acidimicrobiales bacterium]
MSDARGLAARAKGAARNLLASNEELVHLIHAIKNELVGQIGDLHTRFEAASEESAALGSQVSRAVELAGYNNDELQALRKELQWLGPSVRLRSLVASDARITDIDESAAIFLNYAKSHRGPLADRDLWINDPVVIEWSEGNATVGAVNERIMEIPFVIQALGALDPDAAIVDIGGSESTLAFSLASLGYATTLVDPQGYPFAHPRLDVRQHPLEELTADGDFDAAVLLSAIEHFGIGHYKGGPEPDIDADRKAMSHVKKLLKPNGILVLTVPYGPAETNELERIYDRERLSNLLEGWTVLRARVGRRTTETTWEIEAEELIPPAGPGHVAMVVASPS